jgi:hypothetical protein
LRINSSRYARSSAFNRTTYFFTAMSWKIMIASVPRAGDESESTNG